MARHDQSHPDQPALEIEGMPVPAPPETGAEVVVAKKRRAPTEVPRTPSGESASDIIGKWLDWQDRQHGVPVPQTVIARIGKEIRNLIVSGYTSDQIAYGVAAWTAMWANNPRTSPTEVTTVTWAEATRRANGRWVAEMRDRGREIDSGMRPAPTTRRDERQHRNSGAGDDWLRGAGR